MKIAFIISVLMLSLLSCSSNKDYDRQISDILSEKGVEEYSEGYSNEQIDRVFNLIRSDTATFCHEFPERRWSNYKVTTSTDSAVRAYVLERESIGEYPSKGFETSTLIQYKYKGKIYTTQLPKTHSFIKQISCLSDNKYLFIDFWRGGEVDMHDYNRAKVYYFTEKGMFPCDSVFDLNGKVCNDILVNWESDMSDEEDEFGGLFYNSLQKILFIADTKKSASGSEILTGTYKQYQWDGLAFKRSDLIKPLEFKNRDYYVRIEQKEDGSCVYQCWNNGVKSSKPDLAISNGRRQLWGMDNEVIDFNEFITDDASSPLGDIFTFQNHGYKYIFHTGWSRGHEANTLQILNSEGKEIYIADFIKLIE